MNDRKAIARLIRETQALPTLPASVVRLNAIAEDQDVTNQEIARVISSDQILAARVLRLVNSPFYGVPRRVSSIPHALILLGINVVRGLVMSSTLFEIMESRLLGLWEHSLATAVASNIIAGHLGMPDREEVTTAGLLHDIGKIVIRVYLEQDPERLAMLDAMVDDMPVFEAERELLGTDHGELGMWLARTWQLPDGLIEPIACHHDVAAAGVYRQQAAVVHFADLLVKARGVGAGQNERVPRLQWAAREILALGDADIEAIVSALEDRLVEVSSFSLDIRTADQVASVRA